MNEDVDKIVNDLKARGVFDDFRKECLASVDTRPAFENLRQKIDLNVGNFLEAQTWNPSTNKNQLRDSLRKKLADSESLRLTVDNLVKQIIDLKAPYIFNMIDKNVQDYLGIKIEEPLTRVQDNDKVWPETEKVEVIKEENIKWSQDNWNKVNNNTKEKSNPSLSPSTVSSHSLSPPTPEPITDGGSEDSFPAAPSPTSLISGENSKTSQHYFDESTSKSPENKTKNDILFQLSKEGKQSADEPKPEPLDWGINTSPPPERPFAHLGSSSAVQPTSPGTTENLSPTIKSEPKSPELPSSSSSVPLLSNKSKEESREEISEVEESKGKSDPIVSDMLSDVSSAHTSDLSDFDDPMSISSVEEAEDMKKETDDAEGKVVQSEGKVIDSKVKRENDSASQVNEEIKRIKAEDTGQAKVQVKDQVLKENVVKDKVKDQAKDKVKEKVKDQMKDQFKDQVKESVEDQNKNREEIKKRKEPEKDLDPWNVGIPDVKPKFEIIKSTPEAPVFDIRARGKEAICLTPKKPEERKIVKEITTTIKTEKQSEANKNKFVIPKIKREPKSRDPSPPLPPPPPPPARPTTPPLATNATTSTPILPANTTITTPSSSSRATNDESRSKRSSRDSNSKKKSDLSSSQRYDEADLYKPRYSIPGSRRHRSSNAK